MEEYQLSRGQAADMVCFEMALKRGTKFAALVCDVSGTPLLHTPDLLQLRRLADKYGFLIVCGDTHATSINCNLLAYADVIITDLGGMFSGRLNVDGGS